MGVEDLLVVGGKRKASTFVEGDNQDSGLDRGHGRGDERLRGIFGTTLDGRQGIEEKKIYEQRTDSIGVCCGDAGGLRNNGGLFARITFDGGCGGGSGECLGQRSQVRLL